MFDRRHCIDHGAVISPNDPSSRLKHYCPYCGKMLVEEYRLLVKKSIQGQQKKYQSVQQELFATFEVAKAAYERVVAEYRLRPEVYEEITPFTSTDQPHYLIELHAIMTNGREQGIMHKAKWLSIEVPFRRENDE